MEHEGDNDISDRALGTILKRLGEVENLGKNWDHPDRITAEITNNTRESLVNLRTLAVTMTFVKDISYQITINVKIQWITKYDKNKILEILIFTFPWTKTKDKNKKKWQQWIVFW